MYQRNVLEKVSLFVSEKRFREGESVCTEPRNHCRTDPAIVVAEIKQHWRVEM